MSHHLPCKAGTVTELADRTTISGIVQQSLVFFFTLSVKGQTGEVALGKVHIG